MRPKTAANTRRVPWCLRTRRRPREASDRAHSDHLRKELSKPSTTFNPWEFVHKAIYAVM
jgi:hypothetical protein